MSISSFFYTFLSLSLKAQTRNENLLLSLLFVCFTMVSRNSNILQSTGGGVGFYPTRIFICAIVRSSTNKWDIEPLLLSLVKIFDL